MLARTAGKALLAAVVLAPLSACSTTANIVDVHMAIDEKGFRERNVFYTDSKAIFCVGKLGIGRPSVVVEMRVRQFKRYNFSTNKFDDVDGVAAYNEQEPGQSSSPVGIALELQPAGPTGEGSDSTAPFTPGQYECQVYLDGAVEGTALFNIEFPPCPEQVIRSETVCYGFYREGDTCPKFGQSSQAPQKCKCSAAEGWACPPG